MQMLDALQNLMEKFGGIYVINAIIANDVIEELACIRMLHY